MHLKELTQTNHLHLQSNLFIKKSSKTIDTMNRTILVAAANQKPASICILENTTSLVQLSQQSRAKAQPVPYVGLQWNRDSNMSLFLIRL